MGHLNGKSGGPPRKDDPDMLAKHYSVSVINLDAEPVVATETSLREAIAGYYGKRDGGSE